MRLEKKVALITGGAHGMGAAESILFAREGARVIVADILEDEGSHLVETINTGGGVAEFLKLDVTKETEWQKAIDGIVERYGVLDILDIVSLVNLVLS